MSDRYNPPYIDDEEQALIESLESVDVEQLDPPSGERTHQLRRAAHEHMNRASAKMNIRISPEELQLIKERADREGLRYQALVKSVLHKYITGQLEESKRGST